MIFRGNTVAHPPPFIVGVCLKRGQTGWTNLQNMTSQTRVASLKPTEFPFQTYLNSTICIFGGIVDCLIDKMTASMAQQARTWLTRISSCVLFGVVKVRQSKRGTEDSGLNRWSTFTMDSFPFSNLKRETFFKILCVLCAQRWSQRAVALWRTGLLLCFLHICTCLGKIPLCLIILRTDIPVLAYTTRRFYPNSFVFYTEEKCVLGVVGRPVSLPCFYPQLLTFGNFTIEWRKDDKVILRSVFENSQNILELSADRSTLSSNATLTGDFSLEVPAVDLEEPKLNYGLFIIQEVNQNDALCRVCLRIAGQCTVNRI